MPGVRSPITWRRSAMSPAPSAAGRVFSGPRYADPRLLAAGDGAVRQPHSRKPRRCCGGTFRTILPTSPPCACSPKWPGALGRYLDAENLLARCLELAPEFEGARQNYAVPSSARASMPRRCAQVERLLESEPRNPSYRGLQAAVLAAIGEYASRPRGLCRASSRSTRGSPRIWLELWPRAEDLRRRSRRAFAAYRRAVELDAAPRGGLVEPREPQDLPIRGRRVGADAPQLMRTDLQRGGPLPLPLCARQGPRGSGAITRQSFEHYREGNALRRAGVHYESGA